MLEAEFKKMDLDKEKKEEPKIKEEEEPLK